MTSKRPKKTFHLLFHARGGGKGLKINYVMAEATPAKITSKIEPPGSPRGRIFQKVLGSGQTIKPQQRGEPDQSEEEKVSYLSSLLEKPGAFLLRFGRVLDQTDLAFFSGSSDYEVQFRVRQLARDLVPENRRQRTSNRRYQCMKELMKKTDYFSQDEMRQRSPLLFQQYVGQYMTEEEKAELDGGRTSDMTLSSFIMTRMRLDERRERERRQREREEEVLEEEDSSSGEESEAEEATEESKREMRREFLQAMQLSFRRGEDAGFDYSSVDHDERYDSVETQQQDGEDAYFDAEEPEWCTEREQSSPDTHEEDMDAER